MRINHEAVVTQHGSLRGDDWALSAERRWYGAGGSWEAEEQRTMEDHWQRAGAISCQGHKISPHIPFTWVFNLIRWNSWVSQSSIWLQGSEGFILWSSAASFSCSVGRVEAVQCSLYCERHCCLEVCGAVACENDLVTWYLIAWSCGCLSLDPSADQTQRAAEGTLKHSQPHCYVSLGWVGVGGGCVCVLVSIIQSGGEKNMTI